jgi:PAS domain-containing protein
MDAEQILPYISDGFLHVDADWRVRAVNRRAEGLLLQPTQAMVGRSLWEVLPDADGSPAQAQIRAIAAGTVARRVEHFSPSRYTWLEILVVPGAGECMLFAQNVSDRARAMQTDAVRAAVRRIIMDAPVAISISRGPDHRYEIANARARELVGGRDVEGRTVRSVFPELEGTGLIEVLDEVYRSGMPYVGRSVPVTYDRLGTGQLYEGIFDVTYQPLTEADGTVWGIMTIAVEVTEFVRERARLEVEGAR